MGRLSAEARITVPYADSLIAAIARSFG